MGFLERLFVKQIASQVNKQVAEALTDKYNENLFRWLNDGAPVMKPDDYDYISDGYMAIPGVYQAIDLIMRKIQSYPVLIKRLKGSKADVAKMRRLLKSNNIADVAKGMILKEKIYEEVSHEHIDRILERPNEKQSWNEFIGMLVVNFLSSGNAYIYGNGASKDGNKWTELFALPEDMKIISGGTFDPVKEYILWWNTDKEKSFSNKEIKHVKTVNPKYDSSASQLYGISPLRAFLYDLYAQKYGSEALLKMLKNGGVVSLITPKYKEDSLGADQKKALKDGLIDAMSSGESYRRYIPSNIALEVTKVGLPPGDLMLLDLKLAHKKDIMHGAYHIPFSYIDNEQATYNNIASDGKRLMYDAVAPVADTISLALTDFLAKPYDSNLVIEIDWQSAYELTDDLERIMKWVKDAISMGMITPDEGRSVIGWGETGKKEMREHYMAGNFRRLMDVFDGKTINGGQQSGSGQEQERE